MTSGGLSICGGEAKPWLKLKAKPGVIGNDGNDRRVAASAAEGDG